MIRRRVDLTFLVQTFLVGVSRLKLILRNILILIVSHILIFIVRDILINIVTLIVSNILIDIVNLIVILIVILMLKLSVILILMNFFLSLLLNQTRIGLAIAQLFLMPRLLRSPEFDFLLELLLLFYAIGLLLLNLEDLDFGQEIVDIVLQLFDLSRIQPFGFGLHRSGGKVGLSGVSLLALGALG